LPPGRSDIFILSQPPHHHHTLSRQKPAGLLKGTKMTHSRKVGGIAAIILGSLFLFLLALLMYLPSIGFGPGALNDPATGIGFIESSAIPAVIAFLYLCIGIASMIVLNAIAGLFGATNATVADWISFAAAAAGTLLVGYSMSDLVALPYAAVAYHTDQALGGSAYVAIRAVGHGLSAGALFSTGMGVALAGLAGLRDAIFPTLLSVLMMLAGLAVALSFIILPLGLIGLVAAPVWSIWLGVVLLRRPSSGSPLAAMAATA
jgi:hypothetical protein